MRAADAASPVPEAVLVRRAGTAVALGAARLLGSCYGRRVVVLAGTGNNGADGRVAAEALRRRGAAVRVVEVGRHAPAHAVGPCDLVVDAVLGTGFSGRFDAPAIAPGTPVVAVDIPSGVDGDTGEAPGAVARAELTVTFAAWKPGLLQGDGADLAGRVEVADIGLDVGPASIGLAQDADVARALGPRPRTTNKWRAAVAVVAGSPGMEGAAVLAAHGAARAGAGMVRLGVPGAGDGGPWPVEAVRLSLGTSGWAEEVLGILDRCRALVIGPGLGRGEDVRREVRTLIGRSPVPVVCDADALFALGGPGEAAPVLAGDRPVVLTPHDGEYARLLGHDPGPDRVSAARRLAGLGAVGLLKGSLTAVAAPGGGDGGAVVLSASGSSRLATAGTGDVLSGVIGAFLARGVAPLQAAGLGAHVHGRAAALGLAEGLVAPDLPLLVAEVLSRCADAAHEADPVPPAAGRRRG
jgi:NAD(P)H-hydrate epimerase